MTSMGNRPLTRKIKSDSSNFQFVSFWNGRRGVPTTRRRDLGHVTDWAWPRQL